MKKLIAVLVAGVALFPPYGAMAQPPSQSVIGVLQPDGTFHRLSPTPDAAAATTTVTGTLTLKLTITLVSSISTSTAIRCSLDATVTGASSTGAFDTILESGYVVAIRSGSTATCQIQVPYQWTLRGSGDTVALSYSIQALNSTASAGRLSNASFATVAVPKSGSTTAFTLSTRI